MVLDKWFSYFFVALIFTNSACAQFPKKNIEQNTAKTDPSRCVEPIKKNQYMTSRSCFVEDDGIFTGKPEEDFFLQHMATVFSYIGEDKESRQIFDRRFTIKSFEEKIKLSDFRTKSAGGEIIRLAGNRQILAINEAHHVPETRLLTLQLLQPLYEKGFRYLAVETFDETSLDETIQLGFPTQKTGYYTSEPTYALMVREALRLGFKLIPYEFFPKCDPFKDPPEVCQNLREEGQAKRIFERVFRNDPQAKVIIHAGYGHIDKKGGDDSWKWVPMARYLWELTKIEPFSVDQTFFFEKGRPQMNSKIYHAVFKQIKDDGPLLLVNKNTKLPFVASRYTDHYDAQVFLPPLREKNGRSIWRSNIPNVRRTKITGLSCPKNEICLLQAIVKEEINAPFVPMDQTLLRDSNKATLYLPQGTYLVRLLNQSDVILFEKEVEVRQGVKNSRTYGPYIPAKLNSIRKTKKRASDDETGPCHSLREAQKSHEGTGGDSKDILPRPYADGNLLKTAQHLLEVRLCCVSIVIPLDRVEEISYKVEVTRSC